jgi:membrane protease YdiL (CAAX protease family)
MIHKKLIFFTIAFLSILYLSERYELYSILGISFLLLFVFIKRKEIHLHCDIKISKEIIIFLLKYMLYCSLGILSYNFLIKNFLPENNPTLNQCVKWSVLVSICITSILEEIIFRGYFLNKLLSEKGNIISIIIVSFYFSIVHIFTDSGLLYVFLLSLILSTFYTKTRSIMSVILLHLYCNIFSLLIFKI